MIYNKVKANFEIHHSGRSLNENKGKEKNHEISGPNNDVEYEGNSNVSHS